MIVGGYTLDLYCDKPNHDRQYNEFPDQYFGETGAECRKEARKFGWILTKDPDTGLRIAICPKCSGKKVVARRHSGTKSGEEARCESRQGF